MSRNSHGVSKNIGALLPVAFFILAATGAHAASPSEIQQWLDAHNEYRAVHGVPPVKWSDRVAASAQAWADTCPSGHSRSGYGENLVFASYDMDPAGVVGRFYGEETEYDYDRPGFAPTTGHFTQVVWRDTKEIGCARRSNCGGSWPNIWVCQYSPAGNYIGQFEQNVFPPTDDSECPSCYGDSINVASTIYGPQTSCSCQATTSIDVGPDVAVERDATLSLDAPYVSIRPGTLFSRGSYVRIN